MKGSARFTAAVLTAAALGCTALAASAQPGRFMLERMDKDGDGRISEAEFSPRREGPLLERADADGDGMVTRAEVEAMMRERQREAEERMDTLFADMDSDGDGAITAEELRAGRFQRLDANDDGFIDADEMDAMSSRRGMRRPDKPGRPDAPR